MEKRVSGAHRCDLVVPENITLLKLTPYSPELDSVLKFAAGMPACVMAMEACCGVHHLDHQLQKSDRSRGDDGQGDLVESREPDGDEPSRS